VLGAFITATQAGMRLHRQDLPPDDRGLGGRHKGPVAFHHRRYPKPAKSSRAYTSLAHSDQLSSTNCPRVSLYVYACWVLQIQRLKKQAKTFSNLRYKCTKHYKHSVSSTGKGLEFPHRPVHLCTRRYSSGSTSRTSRPADQSTRDGKPRLPPPRPSYSSRWY
jgi:hypothetical protein